MDGWPSVRDTAGMAVLNALLSFLFLASLSARADERYAPLAQMPMDLADTGSPVVPAQVNARGPFWFLLDTGATATTIKPHLVLTLKLPKMAAQVSGLQSMGGSLSADLYRLDSIHYGPLEARNTLSPSFERPNLRSHPIMGVAGIDILRGHAVEFDFKARTIRLHKGFRGGRGWVRMTARFNTNGYAFIPYSVGGVDGEGFIDTGAVSTILNSAFVKALGHAPDGTGLKKTALVGGIEGARIPLYATPPKTMSLGSIKLPDSAAQFADVPIFSRLGPASRPLAILGSDILVRQRFVIDYPSQAVWWHND